MHKNSFTKQEILYCVNVLALTSSVEMCRTYNKKIMQIRENLNRI